MDDNANSNGRSDEGPVVFVEGVVIGRLTNVTTGAKVAPGGDVTVALVVQSDMESWAALAEVVNATTPSLRTLKVSGDGDGA